MLGGSNAEFSVRSRLPDRNLAMSLLSDMTVESMQ